MGIFKLFLDNKKYFAMLAAVVGAIFIIVVYPRPLNVSATVPYVNEVVSMNTAGVQVGGNLSSTSGDGRYVVFTSSSSVLGGVSGVAHVYVRDLELGTTERISLNATGDDLNANSGSARISADGQYVVFTSSATNFMGGGPPGQAKVLIRDRIANSTQLVSVSTTGGVSYGRYPDISADGRYIVFLSDASDLVSGDTNGLPDVFVRDVQLGTNTLISQSSSGVQGDGGSTGRPSISCDGSRIAFTSHATTLVGGVAAHRANTYIVNRVGGHEIIGITINHDRAPSAVYQPISCDGNKILISTGATNVIAGITATAQHLYMYNVGAGSFENISVSSSGAPGEHASLPGSMSADGRYVTFDSNSSNLVVGDTNGRGDIFVRDRRDGTTQRVSMASSTVESNGGSSSPLITQDGTRIIFSTSATNLVPGSIGGAKAVMAKTGLDACEI